MPHDDEIDGTPERKQVRPVIRVEGVFPGTGKAAELTALAVQEYLAAVLGQQLALEVGELDVEVSVEEKICGLDVAVEDVVGVDPGDGLGGFAAPGEALRDGDGVARLEEILGDGAVGSLFEVDARVCEAP
jgi:hypothetical protein